MSIPFTGVASPSARNVMRPILLVCMFALSGCTTFKPPQISYDDDVPPLPSPPIAGGGSSAIPARPAVLDAGEGRQEGR